LKDNDAMNAQRFNWQIWLGFVLSVFAFLSYPLIFVRFPATRDFPWTNLGLFGIAGLLLFIGVRRAFAPDRRRKSKVAAGILASLSVLILGFFIFTGFIMARWLPSAAGAPKIGQQALDFNLRDTSGNLVSLSALLSSPINEKTASGRPKGVLLIFYRGYW
jgi:hypothetical protein